MAAGQHNPSRRALLGAAVGLPLIAAADGAGATTGPLHHAAHGPPPRPGEEWGKALAAFEAARAAVREIEAATAGYGFEDEEALLPAHDAACEAMEAALQHMLFVPAPDLRALGIKFEAAFDHELESSALHGELRYPAILQDIVRLSGAYCRPAAPGTRPRGPR